MSTRLTNAMRDTIFDNAERKAFFQKEEAIQQAKNIFAERLYRHCYGEHEAAMRALPKGFFNFRELRDISVRDDASHSWKKLQACRFSTAMPFPIVTSHFDSLDLDHPMNWAGLEIIWEMEALKEEKRQFAIDCTAILRSVNTVERLLEVWPEIADMVPKQEKKAPLIPFDLTIKLNERLGFVGGAA